MGFVHLHRKEFRQALEAARRSTEIAPNYADGYGLQANIHSYLGEARQAIEINDRALPLNPYYTYEYLITYGIAYYTLGSIKMAIEMFEEIQERNVNHSISKFFLAACYTRENRMNDAQWMVSELLAIDGNLTIAHIASAEPLAKTEHIQMLLADLRKAGMPE